MAKTGRGLGLKPPARSGTVALLALSVLAAGTLVALSPAPAPKLVQQAVVAGAAAGQAGPLNLPVRFEPNVGQFAEGVRFVARGRGGHALSLMASEAVVTFLPDGAGRHPAPPPVRLVFAGTGANPAPTIDPLDSRAGVTNYVVGADPAGWHTGVPGYGRVVYRSVWPGIDVVFHGDRGPLEYDFVVAPGADPGPIAMAVEGAGPISVDAGGDLVFTTPAGLLRQPRPTIYQEAGGGRREPREGFYRIEDSHHFRFDLGPYDRSRPLVIDPEVVYATYLGGTGEGDDKVLAVATGAGGEAYVAGQTASADFPTNPVRPSGGGGEAFVARVSADGKSLVYATHIGGAAEDRAESMAVDRATGAVYVSGWTWSKQFPTPGGYDTSYSAGCCDPEAFLAMLDPAGALTYGTFLGPGRAYGVAPGPNGVAYVVGSTRGGITPTTSPYTGTPAKNDGYLIVVDPAKAGTAGLVYASYIGGDQDDGTYAVAAGPGGRAYVTGSTRSAVFRTTSGAYDESLDAGSRIDAFMAVLDPFVPTGSESLVYSTRLGSGVELNTSGLPRLGSADEGTSIAVDPQGRAYVTGMAGAGFPVTPGAVQTQHEGGRDAFVTVLNPAGEGDADLVYSTLLGGSGEDLGFGIAVGPAGRAYVTGRSDSRVFPTTAGGSPAADAGFFAEIDPLGRAFYDLASSTRWSNQAEGHAVAFDAASGDFFVAGYAYAGINTTPDDVYQPDYSGSGHETDGFLMRIRSSPPACPDPAPATTSTSSGLVGPVVPSAASAPPPAAGFTGPWALPAPAGASRSPRRRRATHHPRRRRLVSSTPAPSPRSSHPPSSQRGFTLIEMLVVIVILGILAGIVVFAVRGSAEKRRANAVAADERIVRTALEAYCAKNAHYPLDPDGTGPKDPMDVLVSEKFLSSRSTYHKLATGDSGQYSEGRCEGGTGPSTYSLIADTLQAREVECP